MGVSPATEMIRCVHCGKEKEIGAFQAKTRKFCSQNCSHEHQREHNATRRPVYGKPMREFELEKKNVISVKFVTGKKNQGYSRFTIKTVIQQIALKIISNLCALTVIRCTISEQKLECLALVLDGKRNRKNE